MCLLPASSFFEARFETLKDLLCIYLVFVYCLFVLVDIGICVCPRRKLAANTVKYKKESKL